jgi:hypothetical protein
MHEQKLLYLLLIVQYCWTEQATVPNMSCQSSETEAARRAGHPVALGVLLWRNLLA